MICTRSTTFFLAVFACVFAVWLTSQRANSVTNAIADLLQHSAKAVVVHVVSIATNTKVTCGSVFLSMTTGIAGIRDLSVGPPDGFTYSPALMPEIDIEFDTRTLISRSVIVATRVTVQRPQILCEYRERGSSVQAIFDSIKLYHGDSIPPFIVIRELFVGAGTLEIVYEGVRRANSIKVALPALYMKDLGVSALGLSFSGIFKLVADPLIENVLSTIDEELRKRPVNQTVLAALRGSGP